MSSHHIVRDNQEPALLLLDGDASLHSLSQDFLEWSPAIIVDEKLLDEVQSWGIKIDIVLFEEINRVEINQKIENQFPLKLISYTSEDESLLAVIDFLQKENYSSLNIFSERTELFSILENLDCEINIALVKNHVRWSLIRSHHFEKWAPSDSQIMVRKNNLEEIISPNPQNKIFIKHSTLFWVGEQLDAC